MGEASPVLLGTDDWQPEVDVVVSHPTSAGQGGGYVPALPKRHPSTARSTHDYTPARPDFIGVYCFT